MSFQIISDITTVVDTHVQVKTKYIMDSFNFLKDFKFINNICEYLDNGKFLFVPDIMYQYWYTLSINSTFDEMNVMNSKLMLEFKVEIRIENCEGVMRVSNINGAK